VKYLSINTFQLVSAKFRRRINQQIFNRKSISRDSAHPQSRDSAHPQSRDSTPSITWLYTPSITWLCTPSILKSISHVCLRVKCWRIER